MRKRYEGGYMFILSLYTKLNGSSGIEIQKGKPEAGCFYKFSSVLNLVNSKR